MGEKDFEDTADGIENEVEIGEDRRREKATCAIRGKGERERNRVSRLRMIRDGHLGRLCTIARIKRKEESAVVKNFPRQQTTDGKNVKRGEKMGSVEGEDEEKSSKAAASLAANRVV